MQMNRGIALAKSALRLPPPLALCHTPPLFCLQRIFWFSSLLKGGKQDYRPRERREEGGPPLPSPPPLWPSVRPSWSLRGIRISGGESRPRTRLKGDPEGNRRVCTRLRTRRYTGGKQKMRRGGRCKKGEEGGGTLFQPSSFFFFCDGAEDASAAAVREERRKCKKRKEEG